MGRKEYCCSQCILKETCIELGTVEIATGSFGRAAVSVGTEETYEGKVNYNRFNKNTQISAIGNANNINENPFSWREFNQFAPENDWNSNLINGIGSREGINEAVSVGINLNHEFNDQLELQNFYYLTQNNYNLTKTVNTQNFNLDTTYLTDQTIEKEENKLNHSFNIKLKWKPDSLTEIDVWSNLFLSDNGYDNFNQTFYTPSNEAINFTENITDNELDKTSTFNSITIKRKLNKDRRNLRLSVNNYRLNEDNLTFIDNERYGNDIIQNQNYDNVFNGFITKLPYTEPLDSYWVVTVEHQYENTVQRPERDFFDIAVDGSSEFNSLLSSSFERISNKNESKLIFRINKNKITYSFGTAFNNIDLAINEDSRNF